MTRSMLSLVLIAGLVATARADSETDTEIRALIQAVAESECEFNRNGLVYSAEAAAEHLELSNTLGEGATLILPRHLSSAWQVRAPGAASPIR